MLVALLAAYLLGGGAVSGGILTPAAIKDIGKQIEARVEASAQAEAMAVIGDLKGEVKAFDKTFGKSGKVLTKLYKDHGATASDMQAVLDDLNAEWEATQTRSLDLRFELKDTLTADEWNEIFGD
jgi:hypothetical protein